LVRILTPIETIKAFSENISKLYRVVIIKPLDKKSTDVFIEIIEFLFQVNIRTVVGDGFVTTNKILKECKELGI